MWQTGVFIWIISDYFPGVLKIVAFNEHGFLNVLTNIYFYLSIHIPFWTWNAAIIVYIMGLIFKCISLFTKLPKGIDVRIFPF